MSKPNKQVRINCEYSGDFEKGESENRDRGFDIYKYILITINAIASVKPKRILPGEKLGENNHCLDHTCFALELKLFS